MYKKGNTTKNFMWVILALLGVTTIAIVYSVIIQSTQTAVTAEAVTKIVSESPPTFGVAGTMYVSAYDQAPDNKRTQRTVPIYIQNPDGIWVEHGGVSTLTSGAKAVTTGIVTGKAPYKVLAFNNTYGSWNGPIEISVTDESPTAEVKIYTISRDMKIVLYDKDDNSLNIGSANLSLSGGQTDTFKKLRVEANSSNAGFNWCGVYIDLAANTNVSTAAFADSSAVSFENNGLSGTLPLSRTTNDDFNWKLSTPVMVVEWKYYDTGSLSIEATGNDVLTEAYTLYAVDCAYFYSAQDSEVLIGPEDDQTAPTDVGARDFSTTGYFN